MRIAFASCICTRVLPDQPVWDWIAAHEPDHLVLLGDSIYLDVTLDGVHPKELNDNDFALRLFALYGELLAQPSFKALVQGLPKGRAWSIWDDHDFLWNDAHGASEEVRPGQAGKLPLTTAFHEAFRTTLAQSLAPGSFPAAYNSMVFWNPAQPPLTTPSIELEPGLWLHLSDDRTWRTDVWGVPESQRTVFGADQRESFSAAINAAPDAVHLFASGSTLAAYKRGYPVDWEWLTGLAANRRILALSGDIHRNEFDASFAGGFPLHEATSSGAAVKDMVVIGERRRNYGLLDIDPSFVKVRLFADNAEETRWTRNIARANWLPVP